MNFIDLAKKRYSVRSYQTTPVEQEKLEIILEAGRVAPTAANQQPNYFLVLNTPDSLQKLTSGAGTHGAPLVIVVCSQTGSAWTRPFDGHNMADIDASIATDHMMMCAEDLGLSSCFITYFNPEVIRTELQIPPQLVPITLLAIGYSADQVRQSPQRHARTRKKLSEMVTCLS